MSEAEKTTQDSNNPVEEIFDTTGFVLDYLAHWKWVLLSVILFIVGAYFVIEKIVPTYEVTSSVYLSSDDAQAKNGAFSFDADNPFFFMKDEMDETELEIIKSRNMIYKVVDSLGMAYQYWEVGALRDKPLYQKEAIRASVDSVSLCNMTAPITVIVEQGKSADTYNIEAKTAFNKVKESVSFKDVKLPYSFELSQGTVNLDRVEHVAEMKAAERIVITNPHRVADAISKTLNVQFAEKASTVLHISSQTQRPQQGIDFSKVLIDFYNRQIIEDKNRSAMQTEAFILDRLVMINDELRDVEMRLQEYRQAHNISDLTVQMQSNFATRQSTESQLAEIEAQQSLMNSIHDIIAQADVYTAVPSATMDNSLNQVIEAYNKRVNQLNTLLQSSSADHPLVVNLKEELTRDKARILQTVESVKRGLQARRANVAALDNRSVSQLASLPPIDKGLQEIFREQQVKVNIYTFLLQKREEIALQKTLATPTARFIESPVISDAPVSPRKMIIYFIALLLGAVVPAVIIYLRRLFFPVYRDQEELQRLTNVPIIAEIPTERDKGDANIVVGENVATAIAELFRLLRNNIGFTKNGAEKKVILLTSSVSGEGKTFIAANLAMTYALTGKRVVVVGLDIRRPMLAHQFGLNNKQGVTTFLSGQIDSIKPLIVQSSLNENLYVLPAGSVPPNPNELLLSDNMTKMITQLRADFDYVILDTAPIGVISDSLIVIPHSDIQLYVARANYSTKAGLKVLHQAVRDNRLPDAYIVLNGVEVNSGAYRYRKYGHYYTSNKKSYGYGYHSQKKLSKMWKIGGK